VHRASWTRRAARVEHTHRNQVRNACEEGWEWRLDDLVMKRAEKKREVLKGRGYTLKKRVST
jgi:hypothetical protein